MENQDFVTIKYPTEWDESVLEKVVTLTPTMQLVMYDMYYTDGEEDKTMYIIFYSKVYPVGSDIENLIDEEKMLMRTTNEIELLRTLNKETADKFFNDILTIVGACHHIYEVQTLNEKGEILYSDTYEDYKEAIEACEETKKDNQYFRLNELDRNYNEIEELAGNCEY